MEKEEFNLFEKRKELLDYLKEQFGEVSIIPEDIIRVVKKQDKEFVKLLKKLNKMYPLSNYEIDQLAGEKLC